VGPTANALISDRLRGVPTREFPRCATLASKAYVRDRRRSAIG
jgi:hypothetical protein